MDMTMPARDGAQVDAEVVGTQLVKTEVEQETHGIIERANGLAVAIRDPETYAVAVEFARECKGRGKRLYERIHERLVKPAHAAWQGTVKFRDGASEPFMAAVSIIGAATSAYDVEQERKARIAREEQERKQREWEAEQAKIKAEQDRLEKIRLAEVKKQEEAKQLELDHLEALRVNSIKDEETARLAHATEAVRQGNSPQAVDAILETATAIAPAPKPLTVTAPIMAKAMEVASAPAPLPLPPPPPPPPAPAPFVPAPAGVIKKDVAMFKIDDEKAFIRAVVEGRIPWEVQEGDKTIRTVMVNDVWVRKQVARLKSEAIGVIPGVSVWIERKTDFQANKA